MGLLRYKLVPLALLAVALALLHLAFGRPVAAVGRAAELEAEPRGAALSALRADPSAWLGERVRFVVQLRAREERWTPYRTRFGPEAWLGFSGWSDERFLWEPEVFADPAPRLFVRRGGAAAAVLAAAAAHERLEATGWVREAFLGEPWIEVETLRPLAEHVPAGAILHVGRGRELVERGQWELAHEQLTRALDAPLPEHAAAEVRRLMLECAQRRDEATRPRR